MPKPWPEVMKEERIHSGMSLYTAAAKLGTNPEHLRLLESGHRKIDPRLLLNAMHLYGGSIFTIQRALRYARDNQPKN